MSLAIEMAKAGTSTPNPHVGCVVITTDGGNPGIGVSEPAGGAHAEAVALGQLGERAQGGTLYVTLEPCNHYGKTPPCTKAIVGAGIRRVVIGVRDPNPKAQGGVEMLREHGIEVEVGVLADQAAVLHQQFLFAMRHQRPMVTVKVGMSLDGRISMPSGQSKWITSPEARLDSMRLREEIGCILVGRKTAEQDRAKLTVRKGGIVPRQPTRVVIDPSNRLDPSLPIFDDSAPTVHWQNNDLNELLAHLFSKGETGVLVEGGATTISHFLRAKLVDQLVLYIAPKILGSGLSWVQDYGLENLDDAEQWCLVELQHLIVGASKWENAQNDRPNNDVKIVYHSRNLQKFLASYSM